MGRLAGVIAGIAIALVAVAIITLVVLRKCCKARKLRKLKQRKSEERSEEKSKVASQPSVPSYEPQRPYWQEGTQPPPDVENVLPVKDSGNPESASAAPHYPPIFQTGQECHHYSHQQGSGANDTATPALAGGYGLTEAPKFPLGISKLEEADDVLPANGAESGGMTIRSTGDELTAAAKELEHAVSNTLMVAVEDSRFLMGEQGMLLFVE